MQLHRKACLVTTVVKCGTVVRISTLLKVFCKLVSVQMYRQNTPHAFVSGFEVNSPLCAVYCFELVTLTVCVKAE